MPSSGRLAAILASSATAPQPGEDADQFVSFQLSGAGGNLGSLPRGPSHGVAQVPITHAPARSSAATHSIAVICRPAVFRSGRIADDRQR